MSTKMQPDMTCSQGIQTDKFMLQQRVRTCVSRDARQALIIDLDKSIATEAIYSLLAAENKHSHSNLKKLTIFRV